MSIASGASSRLPALDADYRTGCLANNRVGAAAQSSERLLHYSPADHDQVGIVPDCGLMHSATDVTAGQTHLELRSGCGLQFVNPFTRDVEEKLVHGWVTLFGGWVCAGHCMDQPQLYSLLAGEFRRPLKHAHVSLIRVDGTQHPLPPIRRVSGQLFGVHTSPNRTVSVMQDLRRNRA